MTLRVVTEGLAAASAEVEALAARLAAVNATAGAVISAVMPPAADAVSVRTALALSGQGAEHAGMAADGVVELSRSGVGTGQSAASYATGDAHAASTYQFGTA